MKRTHTEWIDTLAARGFRIGMSQPYGERRSYMEIRPSGLTAQIELLPTEQPKGTWITRNKQNEHRL